jgi:4-amino-4-deoxy-L-arabinose transferase-like glycosyltransferase
MTVSLMGFSKTLNLINISFDKTTIFIFLRIITVLISIGTILITTALAKKHLENSKTVLIVLALMALNWKFIVLSHYTNADIVLALTLLLSFYMFWLYDKNQTNKNLFLTAIFFGLAVGTKVTALLSLPLFLYVIWKKKDKYGLYGFVFSMAISFMISNPFSIIFFKDFGMRVLEMLSKEGGLVFDSADYSPFKYLVGLMQMVTPAVLVAAIYGAYRKIKHTQDKDFDLFLVANVVLYLLFFSVQSRRVDRWLLPILPIVFIYAAVGLEYVYEILKDKKYQIGLAVLVGGIYLINPILLLTQF